MIKADVGASVHNKFEFRLIDKNGNVKQEAIAYNTVTNKYYNNLNSTNTLKFSYIALGTGTGTPAVTDTNLFAKLTSKDSGLSGSNAQYVDVNKFKISSTVSFSESEAIGELTEIGIHGNPSTYSDILLYTHAMITDAEGHVISINKTDTDRLTITITLYLEITLPNSILPYYGVGGTNYSYYGDQKVTTSFSGGAGIRPTVAQFLGVGSNWSNIIGGIRCVVSPGGTALTGGSPTISASYNNTSTGVRVQSTSRILSEDGNLPGTYQIYGFVTPLGYMPITSDIFTPLTLELTQAADGIKTGFNFKIPELSGDGLEVYIDDVLQPASSYTWNGIDYVNSFQAWETTRADKLIVNPTATSTSTYAYTNISTLIFNNTFNMGQGATWTTNMMVFDYGEAKTFTRAYKPNASSTYTNWEYSNDNENWTTVSVPTSPSTNYYDFPTPITARYLRANFSNSWNNSWTPTTCLLCCYKDQLVFNTAPAAGAIVKIKAKSMYPIKNSNWILDQFVMDFTISRGT